MELCEFVILYLYVGTILGCCCDMVLICDDAEDKELISAYVVGVILIITAWPIYFPVMYLKRRQMKKRD